MIHKLPSELIAHIISYLPIISWCRCRTSSKIFHVDSQSSLEARMSTIDRCIGYTFKPDKGLVYAAKIGDDELFEYFVNNEARDFLTAIRKSVKYDHHHINAMIFYIADMMHPRDTNLIINNAMIAACKKGDLPFIDFLLTLKGITHPYFAYLLKLTEHGHNIKIKDFYHEYMLEDHVYDENEDYILMLSVGQGGNKDIVDYFISEGFDDLNVYLKGAAMGNKPALIDYLIDKGADNFMDAFYGAIVGGHLNLVKVFINKLRKPLSMPSLYLALRDSCLYGHLNITEYLIEVLESRKVDIQRYKMPWSKNPEIMTLLLKRLYTKDRYFNKVFKHANRRHKHKMLTVLEREFPERYMKNIS